MGTIPAVTARSASRTGGQLTARQATQKVQNMNQRRNYPPPTVEEFKALEAEIAADNEDVF